MNQFEFLPLVTIGQYLPTGSIIHQRDARARVVFFILIVLALTFSPSKIGIVVGLCFTLAGIVVARAPLKYTLRGLLAPLPFLIFIALLQILFFSPIINAHVYLDWWIIRITNTGLWVGFMLLMRFFALILSLSLMSFCLSTSEIISGMNSLLKPLNKIGIQTMDFVMVFQVAMRFLPLLAQSAERIAKAQASRGAEWGTRKNNLINQVKRIFPLIVPLFVTSLRRAEVMALAMDARAYGLEKTRTSLYKMKFGWADGVFLMIGFTIFALILFL